MSSVEDAITWWNALTPDDRAKALERAGWPYDPALSTPEADGVLALYVSRNRFVSANFIMRINDSGWVKAPPLPEGYEYPFDESDYEDGPDDIDDIHAIPKRQPNRKGACGRSVSAVSTGSRISQQ